MNISNTKKLQASLLILSSLGLAACGGGGSEDSSSATSNNMLAEVQTNNSEVLSNGAVENGLITDSVPATLSVNSTEDLVVNETFLFSSNYKLSVTVNLDSRFDHLTVCYSHPGSDEVDYENCLLRADLNAGAYRGELLVTNDTDQLIVSAWDYANVENPLVSRWNRDLDGDLISIN